MPDRVCAAMEPMQPAAASTRCDRLMREAAAEQLGGRDDAPSFRRDRRDPLIHRHPIQAKGR